MTKGCRVWTIKDNYRLGDDIQSKVLAFAFGFLTRLTLLPMIFTMIVAFTTVFGGSISAGELPFLYLVIFVLSWFAGAGKFSVDGIIRSKISRGNS